MAHLAVQASGMVTAVGFNAPSTCAAIRAGISGVRVDNLWDPTAGEYLRAARPRTPQWWEGPDMLAELAAPVVRECLVALPDASARAAPVVVLLSPGDRPEREPDLDRIVLGELERRLGALPPGSCALAEGRTGIHPALVKAGELFSSGAAEHVVIVGVDTFLRQDVVDAYLAQRRILTAENSNGFIPGEAACAVLVAPAARDPAGELRVVGSGSGREPGTILGEDPLTGDGLTHALKGALGQARLAMAAMQYWLTDQNAEHYKAKECTIAQIRLERRDRPAPRQFEIWHPIEFLGEIGAAIGPCLLGLALDAARGGWAPGPLALAHVGEDSGARAAFVLRWGEG